MQYCTKNNIIYTYYEVVPEIEHRPAKEYSQESLIELCAKSWLNHGWELKIISEKDALSHPLYNEYSTIIKTFPSINPSSYDYHCYMRWLAMANIGGGVMIDYDVINNTFQEDINFFDFTELTIYQGHVPCVVSGRSEDYFNMLKSFMVLKPIDIHLINNKEHTSDMIMLSNRKTDYKSLNLVANYPKIGKLIHFSSSSCNTLKTNKYKEILNLIQ